jgi:hypothetical protein
MDSSTKERILLLDEKALWDFNCAQKYLLESEQLRLSGDFFAAAAKAQWGLDALDPSFGKVFGVHEHLNKETFEKLSLDLRLLILHLVVQISWCEWEAENPGRAEILLSKFTGAFLSIGGQIPGFCDLMNWYELLWISRYMFLDTDQFLSQSEKDDMRQKDCNIDLFLASLEASIALFRQFDPLKAEDIIAARLMNGSKRGQNDPRPLQLALNVYGAIAMFKLETDAAESRYKVACEFAKKNTGSVRLLSVENVHTDVGTHLFSPSSKSAEHNRTLFEMPVRSLDRRMRRLSSEMLHAAFAEQYEKALQTSYFALRLSQAYGLFSRVRWWAKVIAKLYRLEGNQPDLVCQSLLVAADSEALAEFPQDHIEQMTNTQRSFLAKMAQLIAGSVSHRGAAVVTALKLLLVDTSNDIAETTMSIVKTHFRGLGWNFTKEFDQITAISNLLSQYRTIQQIKSLGLWELIDEIFARVAKSEISWQERDKWLKVIIDIARSFDDEKLRQRAADVALDIVSRMKPQRAISRLGAWAEMRFDVSTAWNVLTAMTYLGIDQERRDRITALIDKTFKTIYPNNWAHYVAWSGVATQQRAEAAGRLLIQEHREEVKKAKKDLAGMGMFDATESLVWIASRVGQKMRQTVVKEISTFIMDSKQLAQRRNRILVTLARCLEDKNYNNVREELCDKYWPILWKARTAAIGVNTQSENPLFRTSDSMKVIIRVHYDLLLSLLCGNQREVIFELVGNACDHVLQGEIYAGVALRMAKALWSELTGKDKIAFLVGAFAIAQDKSKRDRDRDAAQAFYCEFFNQVPDMPTMANDCHTERTDKSE